MKSERGVARRSSMMTLISVHGAIEGRPQFRRPGLARLHVSRSRNEIVECDEHRLAARVHVDHGLEQGIDDEMGAEIAHAVEFRSIGFDLVEHAVDDLARSTLRAERPGATKNPK